MKMIFKYSSIICIVIIVNTVFVFAQQIKDPLSMIVSNYSAGTGVIETKVKYSYFANAKKTDLLDSMVVNYVESSKALYTSYEDQEILSTDGLTIVVLNAAGSIALVEGKRMITDWLI
ncbi:MAG: hypothetical protein IPK10_05445 [Bacteroidetes bacterium]|nr:hypothetical protein [Bacteroidota bacterium]